MGTMDTDAFKMFLQNLEEYVMDENKIITYKWLSKNFNIHVNTAKQLLYCYALEQKDKVHKTYLVGGFLKNDKGGSIQIVREDDVEKIKGEFQHVTSEHIYSVQKAKRLADLNILYTVDVDSCVENDVKLLGSIKCDHPVLRPIEEVAGLKRKTQSAAVDANEKKWPASKKPAVSSVSKGVENRKQVEEPGKNKTVTVSNEENKKEQKKSGIAAMFAAQSSKTKKQNGEEIKSKTEVKKPKTGNGISAFFSRQVDKPLNPTGNTNDSGLGSQSDSQDSPKKMEIASETITDNPKTIEHKNTQHTKVSNKKVDADVSKSKSVKQKSNEKKKNKKVGKDKEKPSIKKRKRIVVMSDSEDDSDDAIFGKEEEDDDEGVCYSSPPQPQQPESDGDDVIPPTPDDSLKKGRKRIRKLTDKTYMDEKGYMLTKKEYVVESCTESEPEEEKEKENKSKDNSDDIKSEKISLKVDTKEPPPKKKKVSPQNTKQATIMNFFKKK